MKISIFLSSFNRRKKLLRLIQSILNQKYQNWELHIVDDGSTDGTNVMIKDHNFEKIKYYHFDKNLGHPIAIFNSQVIKKLNGDLVIFLGSDDYFIEDAFQNIVDIFQEYSNDVWKVGFLWQGENQKSSINKKFKNIIDDKRLISNEIFSDNYIQSDYLFVYRKVYWNKFLEYFVTPDHFFTSFYDVSMKNAFYEIIKKNKIVIAGWGDDNLTKGYNSKIYFFWSLFTRKYLYEKYSSHMGRNYLNYTMRSLLLNLASSDGKKIETFKYFFKFLFIHVNNLIKILAVLPILLVPSVILTKLKKLFFNIRKER